MTPLNKIKRNEMTMLYKPPIWLPDGHTQTIWSALYAQCRFKQALPLTRERWLCPDCDFVDVDRQNASAPNRPLLVLFHGLEGSSKSHYAQSFADWAAQHDLNFLVPHFRGCSGEINSAPRAYHSGDHQEIDWLMKRIRTEHQKSGGNKVLGVGVSLGGNALMRWAAEQGSMANKQAQAIASICSPLDLVSSGQAIGKGFNRFVYTRMFLNTMKPKALAKWKQYPGLFDCEAMMAARDLAEFDDVFTAPIHGFKNTMDYWTKASAKPLMREIQLPALALNAINDPFVPAQSLPTQKDVSADVELWQTKQGGHVGFTQGKWPGHVGVLPSKVGQWLLNAAGIDQ